MVSGSQDNPASKATPKYSNAELLSHLLWVSSGHLITVCFVKLLYALSGYCILLCWSLNYSKLALTWVVQFRQAQCLYEKKLSVIRASQAVKKKYITSPSSLHRHPSPTPMNSMGNTRLLFDFFKNETVSSLKWRVLNRRAVSGTQNHMNGMVVTSQLVVLLQNVLVLGIELTFISTFISAMCTVFIVMWYRDIIFTCTQQNEFCFSYGVHFYCVCPLDVY